jgi:hypothetical protein
MAAKKNKKDQEPVGRRNRPQSVYPPWVCGQILGGSSSRAFTQAIRCWAHLIAETAPQVAPLFSPEEWDVLARASASRHWDWDPESARPGDALFESLRRLVQLRDPGGLANIDWEDLAARLRRLNYVQAWAVITALQWRHQAGARAKGEWWTLPARRMEEQP